MIRYLLFFFVLLLTANAEKSSPFSSSCYVSPQPKGVGETIIENSVTRDGYPWAVSLGADIRGKRFLAACVGILLAPDLVLTSKACSDHDRVNVARSRSTVEQRYVVARFPQPDAARSKSELAKGNDIALLLLNRPFNLSGEMAAACLPPLLGEAFDPNHNVTLIGFDHGLSTNYTTVWREWNRRPENYSSCLRRLKASDPNNVITSLLTYRHVCIEDVVPSQSGPDTVLTAMVQRGSTGKVSVVAVGFIRDSKKKDPIGMTLVQPHRVWLETIAMQLPPV